MKKKDEIKAIIRTMLIVACVNFALSVMNFWLDSEFTSGFIMGINALGFAVLFTHFNTLEHNQKEELKEIREWKTKLGYREDFDFLNRWELKTKFKGYVVSTVDLGLDHSFGIGAPLYYETMIFGDDRFEGYQVRYSTKKEAKKGHKETIKYVKEKLKEDKC